MEPSTSMCPVLVSLPRLLAAPALHYTSSLFELILVLVKEIILTTDALEPAVCAPSHGWCSLRL